MKAVTSFESLQMIEALRSGIPSRLVSRAFTQGRRKILDRIETLLDSVRNGGKARAYAFQAEFGNGKTHLLNQIFDLAWEKNFVVSRIVLNKETPMDKLHLLYQRAAENSFLPKYQLPGFDQPLGRLDPRNSLTEDLIRYADDCLHPRLKVILETYLKAGEENQNLLYRDLQGDLLTNQFIRGICKTSAGVSPRIPPFRKAKPEEMINYLHFLTILFKTMRYSGWVILFDEAELIQRHGPKGRMKAYLNLHRLFNVDGSLSFPLLCVFAFASTFFTFLADRNELELLPEKAREKMDDESADKIQKILNELCKTESLSDLTQQDYQDIASEVERLHGEAFHWQPQLDLTELLSLGTVERRVRTMVRGIIQRLDLHFLNRPIDLAVESIEEPPLEENEGFFRSDDDSDAEDLL